MQTIIKNWMKMRQHLYNELIIFNILEVRMLKAPTVELKLKYIKTNQHTYVYKTCTVSAPQNRQKVLEGAGAILSFRETL